jgi:hypothetical protein
MEPEEKSDTDPGAFLGGVWVPTKAYEYHKRERYKLVNALDDMRGRRDIYKYLCLGLAVTIILLCFLNSCVTRNPN